LCLAGLRCSRRKSHKVIYDKLFQVILKSPRQRLSKARHQGARSQFSSRKIVGRLLAAAVITCLAGVQNMDQGSLCEGIQGYKSGHNHKGPEGGPPTAHKTLSISVNRGASLCRFGRRRRACVLGTAAAAVASPAVRRPTRIASPPLPSPRAG